MLRNRWFRRLMKGLLILLVGFLYVRWANNVQPLRGPSDGYRYAHWLFTPALFLFFLAGLVWFVASCNAFVSTLPRRCRSRHAQPILRPSRRSPHIVEQTGVIRRQQIQQPQRSCDDAGVTVDRSGCVKSRDRLGDVLRAVDQSQPRQ